MTRPKGPVTPKVPKSLNTDGLAEWRRVWSLEDGVINETHVSLVRMYCEAWQEYIYFQRLLALEESEGGVPRIVEPKNQKPSLHPYYGLFTEKRKTVIELMAELGLTPKSYKALQSNEDKNVEVEIKTLAEQLTEMAKENNETKK